MIDGQKRAKKARVSVWVWILLGAVGLAALGAAAGRALLMQLSDEKGPFYLTFSKADVDGDGDTDVLVHNMRKPGKYEVWAGGTLWTNQGSAQGGQEGTFTYRRSDIEGGWASSLADLDGDGDPDLIVYDGIEEELTLGINLGMAQGGTAGIFKPLVDVPIGETDIGELRVLVMGDIDADRRTDALLLGQVHSFAWENQPFPDNISWMWLNKVKANEYFGTDTAKIDALEGFSVEDGALGDLDGDGDLDLMAAISPKEEDRTNRLNVLLLLNDGNGNFSDSGIRWVAQESRSVTLGDLDGDGDLDGLVGTGKGAVILINQGGMQGGEPGQINEAQNGIPGSKTRSIRLADLDNDGDLDVLVSGGKRARLWWNDGQGRFSQGKQSFTLTERQDLTTGDFNGDGWEDIFIAQYDDSAWVWINNGEGKFRKASN